MIWVPGLLLIQAIQRRSTLGFIQNRPKDVPVQQTRALIQADLDDLLAPKKLGPFGLASTGRTSVRAVVGALVGGRRLDLRIRHRDIVGRGGEARNKNEQAQKRHLHLKLRALRFQVVVLGHLVRFLDRHFFLVRSGARHQTGSLLSTAGALRRQGMPAVASHVVKGRVGGAPVLHKHALADARHSVIAARDHHQEMPWGDASRKQQQTKRDSHPRNHPATPSLRATERPGGAGLTQEAFQ